MIGPINPKRSEGVLVSRYANHVLNLGAMGFVIAGSMFSLHSNICIAGEVWYGMVWYGMVWHGMVWYGNLQSRRIRKNAVNLYHPTNDTTV